jgi:site-specific recombinase XerD
LVTKEAAMADNTNTTTVHTAEVVRYDDPVIITERVAVAAFIAGYTDPTRRSYATDLRIFAGWCHDHGINLLIVKRPHLETFARWMEQEGRMASTIGRRLSTLSSFYKYCQRDRTMGPIFLGVEGGRMDRYCADRMVKRLVKRAGIDKRISPHSLRHSFITAALDAGVPLRDVQEAASHADPRTTMRYDRARRSLDRHATYIVSTFIAGATRPS